MLIEYSLQNNVDTSCRLTNLANNIFRRVRNCFKFTHWTYPRQFRAVGVGVEALHRSPWSGVCHWSWCGRPKKVVQTPVYTGSSGGWGSPRGQNWAALRRRPSERRRHVLFRYAICINKYTFKIMVKNCEWFNQFHQKPKRNFKVDANITLAFLMFRFQQNFSWWPRKFISEIVLVKIKILWFLTKAGVSL